jgi:hypothetical protein
MPTTAIRRTSSRRTLGQLFRECPVCGHPELHYEFIIDGVPLCVCDRCKLSFLNQQPAGTKPAAEELNSQVYKLRHAARIEQLIAYGKTGRIPDSSPRTILRTEAAFASQDEE